MNLIDYLGQRGRLAAALSKGSGCLEKPLGTWKRAAMAKGRPSRVTNDEIQKKPLRSLPPAACFQEFEAGRGLAPSRCGRAALRGQIFSHQASCERPAWATVGSSNCPAAWHGGQAVHASTRLSRVHEHQDGRRVGWKASGWSRGQKVPVPTQCLVEIARTDLGPLKQTLCLKFGLMVVIRIFSQMWTP